MLPPIVSWSFHTESYVLPLAEPQGASSLTSEPYSVSLRSIGTEATRIVSILWTNRCQPP